MLILTGQWRKAGVYNMEQLEPEPFLEGIARYGLPWHIKEC
jgi:saccharopine dehydrogenase (NAD+, L-lysine-forming)